jgi:predicted CoA-binding protein
MQKIKEAASEFLASKRVAVTGVSRQPKNHESNIVYRRLRERGFEVFAVNPKADEVEGDPCHQDLRSIPGGGTDADPSAPAPTNDRLRW